MAADGTQVGMHQFNCQTSSTIFIRCVKFVAANCCVGFSFDVFILCFTRHIFLFDYKRNFLLSALVVQQEKRLLKQLFLDYITNYKLVEFDIG